jgi:hypothetical protein
LNWEKIVMVLKPGRYRVLDSVIVELCLGTPTGTYTVDSEARYGAGEIFSIPPTNSPWYYRIDDTDPGATEAIASLGYPPLPPPEERIERIA